MSLLLLAPFLAIVVLFLLSWWQIIISYKHLNAGKFKIIGKIEERLPLSVFDAEWMILGEGKKYGLYYPLTHIERWVPWAFLLIYLCLGIIIAARSGGV